MSEANQNPIQKAKDKPTLANCIKGECYECQGGHISDKFVQRDNCVRVRECHMTACPLWPQRPYRNAKQKEEDRKRIEELPPPAPDDGQISAPAANAHSKRACVNRHCWECVGGSADRGPRRKIRDCEVTDCAIYPVRPWQTLKGRGRHAFNATRDS